MKKQIVNDERISIQRRKIGNEAFYIIFFGLWISILIQQYLLDVSVSQYWVELVLLILVSFYVLVRNIMTGNDIFAMENASRKLILNSIICGIFVTIINAIFNEHLFKLGVVNGLIAMSITFITSTIMVYVILKLFYKINKMKQENIESKLNAEDE